MDKEENDDLAQQEELAQEELLFREMNEEDGFYMGDPEEAYMEEVEANAPLTTPDGKPTEASKGCLGALMSMLFIALLSAYLVSLL